MALQDLTPQLRTRLSRMERAVGWFVLLAAALLAFGFGYYVYNTAERKGWFKIKAPYFTFADRATGLKIGDPVTLMGFEVGRITKITAQPADDFIYNVYLEFELKEPFYDYIWSDGSRAKVAMADLLGKRVLEVTRGTGGYPSYTLLDLHRMSIEAARALPDLYHWQLAQEIYDHSGTNVLQKALTPLTNFPTIVAAGYTNIAIVNTNIKRSKITGIWNEKDAQYDAYNKKTTKPYWLESDESAAVTERLEKLVGDIEAALPSILVLTNQLATVLSNSSTLTSNLNYVAVSTLPLITNLSAATARLDHPGALGEWLLPTNVNHQLEATLSNANITLNNANVAVAGVNTNLSALVENLGRSLDNLAGITGNLNHQVQGNSNIVSAISDTITHYDQFVQGLKHHWLLRSAFKTKKTNEPPSAPVQPLTSPKEKP
jgi:ABC-type transporter Mla subunit MlaD